jgi:SAM-dependent methyltransferase
MIIRPGAEHFIENMVGCDPLYIIDRDHDLLQPSLDRFPQLYQNRLRPYTTNDWSNQPILEKIPNGQFGVCLAYNVFNYRPLAIIRRYLEEIYQKLRPGGALIMTFNDCDNYRAVMLVEKFCASYTPGYLIRDLAQDVGFEQVYTWGDGGPSVWLELRKPGQLTSKRGGQAIASIRNINDYSDDVDYRIRRVYTEDEFIELQSMLAKKYNLDKISDAEREQIFGKILSDKEAEERRIILEEEESRRIKLKEEEEFAKSVDRFRKEELPRLRQRAIELQVGDPNLIRYGYSAEKLKQLIKAKEEGQ